MNQLLCLVGTVDKIGEFRGEDGEKLNCLGESAAPGAGCDGRRGEGELRQAAWWPVLGLSPAQSESLHRSQGNSPRPSMDSQNRGWN
jgi:hypothetical protein